ncbi:MAG: hypothetical protein WEE50_03200 [Chloroflexota bacterium]
MPAEDSLKRLGAGRWETRDGRFAIEPQSGTWVVVDNTQTDELGLPLVRGPFGSLTAAREAIESARAAGPAESPLADRIKQAGVVGPRSRESSQGTGGRPGVARPTAAKAAEPGNSAAPEPPALPEPRWLLDLAPADRRRARELIDRLGALDVPEAEAIARAEITRDQPAIARMVLERNIREAVANAGSPLASARAVVHVILRGKDADLGVRWRVVDDRGRRIDELDVAD